MRHTNPTGFRDVKEKFPVVSEAHSLLWSRHIKATEARVRMIDFLFKEKQPLAAAAIQAKIGGKQGLATTYRSLELMAKVGIVAKIKNPHDNGALYEIRSGRKHHHHAICTSCGFMEDVSDCAADLNEKAGTHLKKFKSVQSHSLEFFGLCRKCESQGQTL